MPWAQAQPMFRGWGGVLSVLSTPNSLPSISPHFPLVPRKGLLLVWSERVKFMGWKSYPEAVH